MSRTIRPGGRRAAGKVREPRAGNMPRAWWLLAPLALLLAVCSPWRRTVENFFLPYLALPARATGALADQSLLLRGKIDLAREVEQLSQRNFALAIQANDARRLADENRRLRALLGLDPIPEFDFVPCDVILRDPWLWNDGFTIDRGSRDGLEPGLAVLASRPDDREHAILLGVVESVAKRSARVISVLNPEFRISVSLPESGAVGFLNAGQLGSWGGGTAAIGFLPANRTFALNEPLFTTGFEALIPGGLLLGELAAIEPAALPFGNRLYRSGIMRPAGDFERLGTVMVARRSAKRPPPDTEQR